jgi:2,3-bisphosphoglycerate-dependent phosphoglycerate mutase
MALRGPGFPEGAEALDAQAVRSSSSTPERIGRDEGAIGRIVPCGARAHQWPDRPDQAGPAQGHGAGPYTPPVTSSLAPLDVLLVRHAEPIPVGSPGIADNDRPLSEAGRSAASELAEELDGWEISAIYSSPYRRAIDTVDMLARRRRLEVQVLEDLRERLLSTAPHDDWQASLARAWAEPDFALPGGESGRSAQRRAMATLDLLRTRHASGGRLVVGSHGNLISLALQHLEPEIGVDFHLAMPMPALYRLTHDGIRWRVMGGHGFAPVDP